MNRLEKIEYHLRKIYELLEEEQVPNKRALTMKELIVKYNITSTTTYRLVHMRNSPAFRVGHDWRVDEDDFILWFDNYKLQIEKELRQHINKEKRLVLQEADYFSRLLYGMNLKEYLSHSSIDHKLCEN
jgi:excisionase family DNA binding protein